MHRTFISKFALLLLAIQIAGCAAIDGGSARQIRNGGNSAPALRLTRTISLPGVGIPSSTTDTAAIPGRLDHLAYDETTGRLFIAALEQGSLEVVDLNKGRRIRRIEGLKKPQGVAVVRRAGCLVVACGDENAVHAYGLNNLVQRAVTPIGQNADNVRCDGANLVYVGFGPNEGSGGLAVYDAAALKKVGEIRLDSRPESFQLDLRPRSNRMWINLPGKKRADNDGSVALVDRSTGRTLATWQLAGAARNFPMAFDAGHDRVFVASRKPPMLFCLDGQSGQVLGNAPCVSDSDDLYFDQKSGYVFVIGGGRLIGEPTSPGAPEPGADAAVNEFRVDGSGGVTRIASVATSPHARTGFLVPQRRAVYVVCPPRGVEDAKLLEFTLSQ
jgi:hypothetical protein